MASVGLLELEKFRFLSNFHARNGNFNSRLDMEINLFSKWWPSAVLNLRKLTFWSRDQYLHVIFISFRNFPLIVECDIQ